MMVVDRMYGVGEWTELANPGSVGRMVIKLACVTCVKL